MINGASRYLARARNGDTVFMLNLSCEPETEWDYIRMRRGFETPSTIYWSMPRHNWVLKLVACSMLGRIFNSHCDGYFIVPPFLNFLILSFRILIIMAATPITSARHFLTRAPGTDLRPGAKVHSDYWQDSGNRVVVQFCIDCLRPQKHVYCVGTSNVQYYPCSEHWQK